MIMLFYVLFLLFVLIQICSDGLLAGVVLSGLWPFVRIYNRRWYCDACYTGGGEEVSTLG